MNDLLVAANVIQVLFAVGIGVSLAFYLVGLYGARDFFRQARRRAAGSPERGNLPGVTILKPLKGLEVDLYDNLSTFCAQDYPRFQIIFGVADADDPAVEVVKQLPVVPSVGVDFEF